MTLGCILTELNMVNPDKRLQIIEFLLLKNGFRTHMYNTYHAAISAKNKQGSENEDNKKLPFLELKMGNIFRKSRIPRMDAKEIGNKRMKE